MELLGEVLCLFSGEYEGLSSRSRLYLRNDVPKFTAGGWSVLGPCLKHRHDSSLVLVSYPLQVLNYPINKIHLVFDSWKIFLYG